MVDSEWCNAANTYQVVLTVASPCKCRVEPGRTIQQQVPSAMELEDFLAWTANDIPTMAINRRLQGIYYLQVQGLCGGCFDSIITAVLLKIFLKMSDQFRVYPYENEMPEIRDKNWYWHRLMVPPDV
jgi:hypothetical protein